MPSSEHIRPPRRAQHPASPQSSHGQPPPSSSTKTTIKHSPWLSRGYGRRWPSHCQAPTGMNAEQRPWPIIGSVVEQPFSASTPPTTTPPTSMQVHLGQSSLYKPNPIPQMPKPIAKLQEYSRILSSQKRKAKR
ncbi:hypothetical protein Dimus_028425 [Dionaea muscipula]